MEGEGDDVGGVVEGGWFFFGSLMLQLMLSLGLFLWCSFLGGIRIGLFVTWSVWHFCCREDVGVD